MWGQGATIEVGVRAGRGVHTYRQIGKLIGAGRRAARWVTSMDESATLFDPAGRFLS